MKKIIFVRHGRAEDQTNELTDFERSLTSKGKQVARQMAQLLRETEPDPGIIFSSPAFRAIETAYIFASEFGIPYEEIVVNSNLYFRAGVKVLFELLSHLDNEKDTITLFGHNPAFTEMPDRLSTTGCEFLTKTAIVCISFNTDNWSGVKLDSGRKEYFLKPEK